MTGGIPPETWPVANGGPNFSADQNLERLLARRRKGIFINPFERGADLGLGIGTLRRLSATSVRFPPLSDFSVAPQTRCYRYFLRQCKMRTEAAGPSPAASVSSDPPIDWARLERIRTLR
jgi:hypothetical protein